MVTNFNKGIMEQDQFEKSPIQTVISNNISTKLIDYKNNTLKLELTKKASTLNKLNEKLDITFASSSKTAPINLKYNVLAGNREKCENLP